MSWASGADLELQAVLDAAQPDDDIPVIVKYRGSFSPRSFRKLRSEDGGEEPSVVADARRERRREIVAGLKQSAQSASTSILELARAKNARDIRVLWMSNSIALRGKRELIWSLLADRRVLDVHLDQVVSAPLTTQAVAGPVEWNVNAVGASQLWSRGFHGENTVIAVFDSGVDPAHPDLAAAYRGGANSWFDPYGQHATPTDKDGHGTQVTGIVVGGAHGGSTIGVAPQAKWIAAKIFNDGGLASESAIHLAFQWVIDPDGDPATDDAPDVVTNSWDIAGEGTCSSVFQSDIDALRAADIALVFSAGNFGPYPASSVSPANNARVSSVGSVDAANLVSIFSSRGPSACDGSIFPKVVAPGEAIRTADLSLGGVANYTTVEGTSFSAPHVAGVVALLRGAVPTSTAAELEAVLAATAHDLGTPGPDNDSGYGLVDAEAAFNSLTHPIDDDEDGYSIDHDCNDQDASIHPGAAEVIRDGVDQDCNGFDNTIDVKYAVYSHDGSKLNIRVTSFLGADADLEIVGIGKLAWRAARRDWVMGAGTVVVMPSLTIRGPEGEVQVTPRQPRRRR